jgi:hypothetical protein
VTLLYGKRSHGIEISRAICSLPKGHGKHVGRDLSTW